MILTMRVECVWGIHLREKCVRVIEIDDGASLLDLQGVIQDSVGFDQDHMFEFFAGRNYRNRKIAFADDGDGEYAGDALDKVTLAQVYAGATQRA